MCLLRTKMFPIVVIQSLDLFVTPIRFFSCLFVCFVSWISNGNIRTNFDSKNELLKIIKCLSFFYLHSLAVDGYRKSVLKEYETIQNGIGTPDIYLALCLGLAWVIIVSVLIKGVQSSGKASYFLGIHKLLIWFHETSVWTHLNWLAFFYSISFVPVCHPADIIDSSCNSARRIWWHFVFHPTAMGSTLWSNRNLQFSKFDQISNNNGVGLLSSH